MVPRPHRPFDPVVRRSFKVWLDLAGRPIDGNHAHANRGDRDADGHDDPTKSLRKSLSVAGARRSRNDRRLLDVRKPAAEQVGDLAGRLEPFAGGLGVKSRDDLAQPLGRLGRNVAEWGTGADP